MIINIREGVFETNSSSTHSLIISKKRLIREFVEGKHKINLLTQQIVEDGHEQEALEFNIGVLEKFIEFDFNRDRVAEYFGIVNNYECGSCIDIIHKQINRNAYRDISGKISYIQFKTLLSKEKDFRDVVLKNGVKLTLITFDEMTSDCELSYTENDFYRDPNGEIFTAISIYGSDSFDTGKWPTK